MAWNSVCFALLISEANNRLGFLLIYAKHSFRASPRHLTRELRSRVAARPVPDLEEAREWLIALGQLEQAVLDEGREGADVVSAATIAAADLFLAKRSSLRCADRTKSLAEHLVVALHRTETILEDRELQIRVPEGFAWYALYPDSYAQTAEAWSHRYGAGCSDISVVGLRSIGTTLAAVVAQALRNRGLTVTDCLTVRTSGEAFSRRVELPAGFAPASQNIIVDEGPGLSGSSMVAVAGALQGAGADAAGIHFFSGHGHGPGRAADESIREWWRAPRVWTTDLDSTIVDGSALPNVLFSLAETCADERVASPAEHLGTADWMSLAGLASPPRAIAPVLETPKKVVRLRSGRAILLKFAGCALTSTEFAGKAQRLDQQALPGPTIVPCGSSHGWVAMPWVEGERLTVADGNDQFLAAHLAPWIAAAATEALSVDEIRNAVGRIAAALKAWATMRDGAVRGSEIEHMAERAFIRLSSTSQPGYGDGRLAPHEWIRTPAGAVMKADSWGHDCDHTWVGRQPLVWDLAGAEIEWELDAARAAALCACVRQLTGAEYSDTTRAFYKAGYCVFRAAAAHHSAAAGSHARMRAHLLDACRWYERRIEAALTLQP